MSYLLSVTIYYCYYYYSTGRTLTDTPIETQAINVTVIEGKTAILPCSFPFLGQQKFKVRCCTLLTNFALSCFHQMEKGNSYTYTRSRLKENAYVSVRVRVFVYGNALLVQDK